MRNCVAPWSVLCSAELSYDNVGAQRVTTHPPFPHSSGSVISSSHLPAQCKGSSSRLIPLTNQTRDEKEMYQEMKHTNGNCILCFGPADITREPAGFVSGGRGVGGWLC